MSDIPVISVTREDPDEISDGEMSDCDIKNALTDIEDFDDSTNEMRNLKVFSKTRKPKSSPTTTDVEDYEATSSDEEKDLPDDDAPLSITEFLEQGTVETKDAASNKITTTHLQKNSTLFVSYLNEDQGCITDCETYDSSGDEISVSGDVNEISISAYLPEAENVAIKDQSVAHDDTDAEDNDSDMSVSEAGDMCNPNEISDTENLSLSDGGEGTVYKDLYASVASCVNKKEVIENAPCTDLSASAPSTCQLQIPEILEENLTDIEKLDSDSDAEVIETNLKLSITPSQQHRASLTDIEDLDTGNTSDSAPEPQQVSPSDIPAAVREITIVKVDELGQGVTRTMPLQDAFHTGIGNCLETGGTDVEDISADEDSYGSTTDLVIAEIPKAYLDLAKNIEIIKDLTVKNEPEAPEPLTDVEEIFMPGTVRRKKSSKLKSQQKNKKALQAKDQPSALPVTDIEDFDVSDVEGTKLAAGSKSLQVPAATTAGNRTPDLKTDVEELSTDEEIFGTDADDEEKSKVVAEAIKQVSSYSTETTIESIYQSGSPYKPREIKPIQRPVMDETDTNTTNQNLTDIEDVNLVSDIEDSNSHYVSSYSRAETLSHSELQNALNESSVSIVHEKCGRAFDMDKEKHHIKGLSDCPESHTDVEYIEDENENEEIEQPVRMDGTFDNQSVSEHIKDVTEDYETICKEAVLLVDSILEQSVMIVSAQQCNDTYNSESDHYAITCDVNGIDMVKSPTIESLSGKSFDDNISVSDDSNIKMTPCTSTTTFNSTTTTTTSTFLQPTTSSSLIVAKIDSRDNNNTNYANNGESSSPIAREFERSDIEMIVTTSPGTVQEINDNDNDIDIENDTDSNDRIETRTQATDSDRVDTNLERIERKFERLSSQLDDIEESAICFDKEFDNLLSRDDLSNLQSDFSKISWDESVSGTTTAADVGLGTPDNDLQDLPTEPANQMIQTTTSLTTSNTTTTDGEAPKPTPRTRRSIVGESFVENERAAEQVGGKVQGLADHGLKRTEETIVETVDFKESKKFWQSLESESQAPPPIPKPRMQVRLTEDLVDSQKDSSQGSKISSEQLVECSEASSFPTSMNEDRSSREEVSEISDVKIDDEIYAGTDLDPSETKPADISISKKSDKPSDSLGEDTDNDELESKSKPSASFYIGESSTNIITKSTTEKRQDFAFDNKGYEEYPDIEGQVDSATKSIIQSSKNPEFTLDLSKPLPFNQDKCDDSQSEKPYVLSIDIPETEQEETGENKLFRQDSETRNDILDDAEPVLKRIESIPITTSTTPAARETIEASEFHFEDQVESIPQEVITKEFVVGLDEIKENIITKTQEFLKAEQIKSAIENPQIIDTHIPVQKELREASTAQEEAITNQTSEPKSKIDPKLDLNFDKSELEPSEKSFGKVKPEDIPVSSIQDQKVVLSPIKSFKGFTTYQETSDGFKKSLLIDPSQADQTMVEQTLDEVEESLEAVQEELIEVVKDGKLIKESPSEFEFKLLPHIKYTSDPIQESHQEELERPSAEEYPSISSTDESSSKGEVVHRLKKDHQKDTLSRWSVPDVDHSSSGESHYQSFEKTDSRPLSSDVENLMTCGNSSEYQTALDASLLPESTEYVSAVSTLDHSGKTISSRESMKSLDSQSSANLGSMDVSELSETLVPSVTDPDIEAEIQEQDAEDFDIDDNEVKLTSLEDKFCGVLMEEYQKAPEEPSLMKRSHEMTFQQESQPEPPEMVHSKPQEEQLSTPQEKEESQAWKFGTSAEDSRISEEFKFASSLEEGSVLSMSLSSASCIDTVVENAEDLAGSYGASSLAGCDILSRDDFTGTSFDEPSKTEKIDSMVMTSSVGKDEDSNYANTQITTVTVSSAISETTESETKRKGHKRNESTSITSTDFLKDLSLQKGSELSIDEEEPSIEEKQARTSPVHIEEKKESESESDYDAYESEYSRAFKAPTTQKKSKDKRVETFEKDQEPEKRPFTPSQSVSEAIMEDAAEEIETMKPEEPMRRPSQNMQDYSNIPDITVTEDLQKYCEDDDDDDFQDNVLYKAKTQEELDKKEDDTPIHYAQEQIYSIAEDEYQDLIERQYESKIADITTKFAPEEDEDEKADSPDSFEMLEQPDISDEFVIIEEVAKEAHEFDPEGKSIQIKTMKQVKKHDEEVEQILVKSAPAAPNAGSTLFRDDLNFEFEESPPTDQDKDGDSADAAAASKRWVEMQLSDNAGHLRYPYEMERGILEDIKEEDAEFEVGSSRISSFKDSFSSTPEYDVLAGRKYFSREHDNVSMSSLQEFENLEQAISLENRRAHQGSQDSNSNGSFTKRYMARSAGQGDDISLSSLKEFEGLENACLEAHLIEIKAKEEAALLSRSDESNKSSNGEVKTTSPPTAVTSMTTITTVSQKTITEKVGAKNQQDIDALLRAKLDECEEEASNLMEVSTDSLEMVLKKPRSPTGNGKDDSQLGSCDSLEINKSGDIMTSSIDSFEISKDATARSSRSDVDSLEQQILQDVRRDSIDSIELEYALQVSRLEKDNAEENAKTQSSTTTTTIVQGPIHTVTRVTTTQMTSGSVPSQISKDISSDSLDLNPNELETLLSSTGSIDRTSSTATNATYQNENDSLMSGSMTSCGSNTMIDTLESGNFMDMYQGGSGSVTSTTTITSQTTIGGETITTTHRQFTEDGEKRYEYFEIFGNDNEKDMQNLKKAGECSKESKGPDEQGK